MEDILPIVIVPTITAILAPVILALLGKWLNKRKESADLGAALREELRGDNKTLRERNKELEGAYTERNRLQQESDTWQRKFFEIKKEKQYLEFELTLLQREIEHIRRQHEEYTAIRERAERQFDNNEPDDGESSD